MTLEMCRFEDSSYQKQLFLLQMFFVLERIYIILHVIFRRSNRAIIIKSHKSQCNNQFSLILRNDAAQIHLMMTRSLPERNSPMRLHLRMFILPLVSKQQFVCSFELQQAQWKRKNVIGKHHDIAQKYCERISKQMTWMTKCKEERIECIAFCLRIFQLQDTLQELSICVWLFYTIANSFHIWKLLLNHSEGFTLIFPFFLGYLTHRQILINRGEWCKRKDIEW